MPKVLTSGLKIKVVHELHRVFIISSVLSWGRFYDVPMPRKPEEEVLWLVLVFLDDIGYLKFRIFSFLVRVHLLLKVLVRAALLPILCCGLRIVRNLSALWCFWFYSIGCTVLPCLLKICLCNVFFMICLTLAYRCNVDDLMMAVGKSYFTLTLGDLFYVSIVRFVLRRVFVATEVMCEWLLSFITYFNIIVNKVRIH